jgi:hypothetical protein
MIPGRVDDQAPEQSLRVNSNMSFSPVYLLESVEAADSAYSRARNRLAVDNQRTWFSGPTGPAPS